MPASPIEIIGVPKAWEPVALAQQLGFDVLALAEHGSLVDMVLEWRMLAELPRERSAAMERPHARQQDT